MTQARVPTERQNEYEDEGRSASSPLRLIAVVPTYNEEKNVAQVIEELKGLKLKGFEIDLVVIDDGSSDLTGQVARRLGARVVSMPYNMGIGIAVQTGFRYALSHGAALVVQVDGDCQHVPEEIEKLLQPVLKDEADVVIGSRFATPRGMASTTWTRWLVSRALALHIQVLTGFKITDATSGFRLYNGKAARFIADFYPDDYPEVEILVPLFRQGFRVKEVSVQMRPRKSGRSSIGGHQAIYYVVKVVIATLFHRIRGRK